MSTQSNDTPAPQWQKDAAEAAANAIGRITVAAPDQDFPSYEDYWNELRSRILLFIAHYAPQTTAPTAQPEQPAATGTVGATPRTDAAFLICSETINSMQNACDFARQLERELDEARAELHIRNDELKTVCAKNDALRAQLTAHADEKHAINAALNKTDSRGMSEVEQIEWLAAEITALRGLLKDLSDAVINDHEDKRGPDVFLYRRAEYARARISTPTAGGKEGK